MVTELAKKNSTDTGRTIWFNKVFIIVAVNNLLRN